MSNSVLIIEDDAKILELISIHIEDLGYGVEHTDNGSVGLQRALSNDYVLVILDVMLPGMNGIEVCKGIRKVKEHLPILMLTAKSDEFDRVFGLEIGADDYVTKPFSVRELVARIKALMRRVDRPATSEQIAERTSIVVKDLTIDLMKHEVRLGNNVVELTVTEFEILAFLAVNPGRTFTRAELLRGVWGFESDAYERTINTHISRLRRKLEPDPENPQFLFTIRGIGYRFSE